VRGADAPRRVIFKDWAPAFAGERKGSAWRMRSTILATAPPGCPTWSRDCG